MESECRALTGYMHVSQHKLERRLRRIVVPCSLIVFRSHTYMRCAGYRTPQTMCTIYYYATSKPPTGTELRSQATIQQGQSSTQRGAETKRLGARGEAPHGEKEMETAAPTSTRN